MSFENPSGRMPVFTDTADGRGCFEELSPSDSALVSTLGDGHVMSLDDPLCWQRMLRQQCESLLRAGVAHVPRVTGATATATTTPAAKGTAGKGTAAAMTPGTAAGIPGRGVPGRESQGGSAGGRPILARPATVQPQNILPPVATPPVATPLSVTEVAGMTARSQLAEPAESEVHQERLPPLSSAIPANSSEQDSPTPFTADSSFMARSQSSAGKKPTLFEEAAPALPASGSRPPMTSADVVQGASGLEPTSVPPPRLSKPLPLKERVVRLQVLADQVAGCTRCEELAATRTQTVFGVGNPLAKIVFVGEAPGADEDATGEPFVGRAGQLLNKIIEASQLKRDEIYICNILKCRPPGNRTPAPPECLNCREYLDGQLQIIDPDYIVCWGSVAATNLLGVTVSIGKLRGQFFPWGRTKVLCTYHPSYLLRNPAAKKDVWDDMKFFRKDMGVVLT